jgi:hypothetical protein
MAEANHIIINDTYTRLTHQLDEAPLTSYEARKDKNGSFNALKIYHNQCILH